MARTPKPKTEGQRQLIALGLSMADIGKAAGVSRQFAHMWILGKKLPTLAARKKLQEALSIPYFSWTQAPIDPSTPPSAPAPTSPPPSPAPSAGTLTHELAEIDSLLTAVRGVRASNPPSDLLMKVVNQEASLLERRAKIQDRDEMMESRLSQHPAYVRVIDLILGALAKHPEARAEVERAPCARKRCRRTWVQRWPGSSVIHVWGENR